MSWTIDNVVPTVRNGEMKKYNTSISAGDLAELYNEGTIIYEGNIQRGTKLNAKGKEIPIASAKKIREIYQAALREELHGGTIVLNYLKEHDNDGEPLKYDMENHTLSGKFSLLILDGQHRIKACERWLKEFRKKKNQGMISDPYEYEFPVTIENLSEEDMKKCFAEYALMQKKISKTRAEFLNVGDFTNHVIRYINQHSEIKGRIECTTTSIRGKNPNVVTFSTLSQAIKYNNFNIRTKEEAQELGRYLSDFIDILVNVFPQHLGNVDPKERNELKQEWLVGEALTFYGYMRIAKDLYSEYNTKKFKEKIKLLDSKVKINGEEYSFLSKSNPIWKNIFRDNNKIINNTSTQRIMTETMSNFIKNNGKIDQKEIEQKVEQKVG